MFNCPMIARKVHQCSTGSGLAPAAAPVGSAEVQSSFDYNRPESGCEKTTRKTGRSQRYQPPRSPPFAHVKRVGVQISPRSSTPGDSLGMASGTPVLYMDFMGLPRAMAIHFQGPVGLKTLFPRTGSVGPKPYGAVSINWWPGGYPFTAP